MSSLADQQKWSKHKFGGRMSLGCMCVRFKTSGDWVLVVKLLMITIYLHFVGYCLPGPESFMVSRLMSERCETLPLVSHSVSKP